MTRRFSRPAFNRGPVFNRENTVIRLGLLLCYLRFSAVLQIRMKLLTNRQECLALALVQQFCSQAAQAHDVNKLFNTDTVRQHTIYIIVDLYEYANRRHERQGLGVFVPCVKFGSHPYPFRTVLRFNVASMPLLYIKSNWSNLKLYSSVGDLFMRSTLSVTTVVRARIRSDFHLHHSPGSLDFVKSPFSWGSS